MFFTTRNLLSLAVSIVVKVARVTYCATASSRGETRGETKTTDVVLRFRAQIRPANSRILASRSQFPFAIGFDEATSLAARRNAQARATARFFDPTGERANE